MTDKAERFGWLERPGDDFPFYNGEPAAISGGQWWLVMAAILAGFLVLTLSNPLLTGAFLGFVPIVAFFALPLAALKYVAPRGWTAIFRRLRLRDALVMAGFALINILVTGIAGAILISVIDTTVNPAIAGLAGQDTPARILFFAKSVPQLFGEEVLTILPFLALLTWLTGEARGGAQTGDRDCLAFGRGPLRRRASADLWVERDPGDRRRRRGAPRSHAALYHDQEYPGMHRRAYPQRLVPVRRDDGVERGGSWRGSRVGDVLPNSMVDSRTPQ